MSLHQDSSEFLLSNPQLSIKHLLMTAFLTPACLYRRQCPPVNNPAPSPFIDARQKTAILASKQQARHYSYTFLLRNLKSMFSQGHCRPSIKKKSGEKSGKGRETLQSTLFCSPAVYSVPQRLSIVKSWRILGIIPGTRHSRNCLSLPLFLKKYKVHCHARALSL